MHPVGLALIQLVLVLVGLGLAASTGDRRWKGLLGVKKVTPTCHQPAVARRDRTD